MALLALLRHGQSAWNLQNRFTGWVDVPLTAQGEAEAMKAGELFHDLQLTFARAYTSVLQRAIRTAEIALERSGQSDVSLTRDWRLNERHYGGLTGLDKAETIAKHGEDQVKIWRRSYDIPPPPMAPGGEHDFAADPRYAGVTVPTTESLKTTLERVLPYWTDQIAPPLARGETVLVAAHGNSIRAIVKHLFQVPDDQIVGVEVPTGNPLLIDLDNHLKPTAARYLEVARQQALPPIPHVTDDDHWMGRALALAAARAGKTAPNPAVGCVLVEDGAVLAQAATAPGGRPHAEEQALDAAGGAARGVTAYVTLEPCGARSGGGSSCAERLAAAGVARVVIGCPDPSPYASGRGLEQLARAGVSVTVGVLQSEASAVVSDWLDVHGRTAETR